MSDLVTADWLRELPKAEVHLHLEGCLPLEVVRQAALAAGKTLPPGAELAKVSSLGELLSHLDWSCGLISTSHQLEQAAYEITERAAASGAMHVDVIFNPTHWPRWEGRLGEMVAALDAGLGAGEEEHGVSSTLSASIKRDQSGDAAMALVGEVLALDHRRLRGLSIDGNEAGGENSHNERFAPAFEAGREGGLRLCAHAGESSGPEGVRQAIELLGAERIDHGIRALEDEQVTALLARTGTPLDICPSSNVILGVVDDMASHPIEPLRRAGVRCSVNTDDPLLYGIDLRGEYGRVADTFGYERAEMAELARVSIESSFAEASRVTELLGELDAFLGRTPTAEER